MRAINFIKRKKGKIKREIIKLANIRYRFIEPPIIQLSPARTGSVLLFNALKICFPKKKVLKYHILTKYDYFAFRYAPKVISIRNPLDSIYSFAQINKRILSDETELREVIRTNKKRVNSVIKVRNKANVKILKYEHFAFNFDYLFSELEIFFNQPIAEDLKQKFIKEYAIDKVLMKVKELGDSFDKYDKISYLHGKHISKYRGANGYYKKAMTQEQINLVYSELKEVFVLFGYEAAVSEK